jgi:hypothetical protein
LLDVVPDESDRLGLSDARKHGDVVQLVDRVLEAEPLQLRVCVDDEQPAARHRVLRRHTLVELQPLERVVAPRPRKCVKSWASD